jgi:hypothetical protein
MMNAYTHAAAFILRKKSRSRRYVAMLTPWSAGLVIHPGDFIQSDGMAWQAVNGGTTGAVAPNNTNGATVSDGVVDWTHVAVLLTQQPVI